MLAGTAYDLALLDITLPDGDGLTLAEGIRSGAVDCLTGTDLRLVMLTAGEGCRTGSAVSTSARTTTWSSPSP